jgi:hypothetical protein
MTKKENRVNRRNKEDNSMLKWLLFIVMNDDIIKMNTISQMISEYISCFVCLGNITVHFPIKYRIDINEKLYRRRTYLLIIVIDNLVQLNFQFVFL